MSGPVTGADARLVRVRSGAVRSGAVRSGTVRSSDVAAAVRFVVTSPGHTCPTEVVLQPQLTPRE